MQTDRLSSARLCEQPLRAAFHLDFDRFAAHGGRRDRGTRGKALACVMPGDAREYRRNALRCAELAQSARAPELKQTLTELSKTWLKLAVELERTHALLDTDDPPPVVPRKG